MTSLSNPYHTMKTALYGSIAWRHPLGIGQAIDWACQHGWDALDARGLCIGIPGDVELNLNAFGYDMLGPRQISPPARRELGKRLEEAGLPLLCIYCASPVNLPGKPGDDCRQLFREYLELAADLGICWIRSINNTVRRGPDTEMSVAEAHERTVEGLRDVGRTASELGVGILLENNENTVTPDAASLARLRRDAGEICRIGIAYDPVNAYFQGLDPLEGFRILAGQIDFLHAKNVRRHSDHRAGYIPRGDVSYEWTALADGDLDWPDLITRARAAGFDGPITYEYVNPFKGMPLSYWDNLRDPVAASRVEADYLRSLVTP